MNEIDFLKQHPEYQRCPLGKAKDITGIKFHKLTPLYRVTNPNNHGSIGSWLCKCDCGNYTVTTANSLKTGHTKSCGCYQKERVSSNEFIDETGNKYGRLTVIKLADKKSKSRQVYWQCQCECGNIAIIRGASLRDGTTTSCGCIQSHGEEKVSALLRELNIKFQTQYKFNDLKDKSYLRFDFAIFDDSDELICLIEYQGKQHYKTGWVFTQERLIDCQRKDELKREYCKKNSIPLIEISYKDYNKLNELYLLNRFNAIGIGKYFSDIQSPKVEIINWEEE